MKQFLAVPFLLIAIVCVTAPTTGCGSGKAQASTSASTQASDPSVSSSNYVNIVNGQQWPLNFVPFCSGFGQECPFNNPLPDSPTLMANSSGMISSVFGSGSGMTGLSDAAIQGGSTADYGHPVYLASNTDPLVTLGSGCGSDTGTTGSQIRIPAKARPTTSSDLSMGVIQPNGDEWDFWQTARAAGVGDWQTGDTINCSDSGSRSNVVTGTGSLSGSATSGSALSAGQIRVNEMDNGVIPHALYVVALSEFVHQGSIVYPGTSASGASGLIPIGARVQLKWTDAQIDAMTGQAAWEKTLLHQMHDYGLYILDCGGDGALTFKWESPTQYTSFGGTNPGAAWASANGPPSNWKPSGINWATDLQIVDPCYAEGSC